MKVTQTGFSQINKRSILGISKSEKKEFSYFNPENFPNEEQKMNISNISLKNDLENGGRIHNLPPKKYYRELFVNNIGDIPQINNNINNTNINRNDINTINYTFYNEPGLINKIRRNENMVGGGGVMNNNSNNDFNNNIINNTISNNEQNNINFSQINNDINKNEEEKKTENQEEKKEKQKKIIDEFSILEKVLKEDQNLFLYDNYHISNSNEYEGIPEELSSYIISKRVNFPKEIYQSFPSVDNNDSDSNLNQPFLNEEKKENYILIYPPINCIIFAQNNVITFFNYINESSIIYNDFTKSIKKLLITIPKPGIFINDIKFIMICVMEGEIQLLSLAFKNNDDLPIVHKTDFIFNFNETVIDLISTSNYRIFMSTLNNKIYELDYSIKQNNYFNFFGPKNTLEAINKEKPIFFGLFSDLKFIFKQSIEIIYKLKVDNTRNILYAIKYTIPKSEKTVNLDKVIDSSIIIFDLGIDGKGFSKVEEISQEDLGDYGFDFNGFINYNYNYYNNNYLYNEDINENNNLIQKSNIIVDITPLTREKFKEYHLVIMKRNGNKIFLKFNTFIDDSNIKNQDEILKFNNSAFCRERITDRFISVLKQIPISKYNKNNKGNQIILYDIINYFPFSTFCYYKNKNINDASIEEYILKVIEDDFSNITKKENMQLLNQNEGLKETEQLLFKSTTNSKNLHAIIKLSDYNIEDTCGLGNLLKNNSNNIYMNNNIKYLDNSLTDSISYNCMHEYARQLFYSPEEYAMLFNDEFIIFKRLRPIDTLIEIIQYKNLKNNSLNEKDNLNSNDILNNSSSDLTQNLISNENSNSSHINVRKNVSMTPLLGQKKNKLNTPFQINRDKIMMKKLKAFLSVHGYIETTVMLLNIITNYNFNYYIKNKIENPNIIRNINNYNFNFTNNNINNNNNNNDNYLNSNELGRCYLNPYSLIQIKNDNQLMKLGQDFLMKIFICAKEDIDFQIFNYQNLLQNLLNNVNLNKEILSNNNNNFRFRINNNNMPTNIFDFFEAKNFMSYGFILFLSRIVRLFWEENIFVRNKLYYQNDSFEFNIINNLNQNQILFIKNMLIKFINIINQYKNDLLQNASDIASKSNKLKNNLNDIELFLNNNSAYTINEIKRKLSAEDQNILNNHKKNLKYYISIFNFENLNNELNVIISITNRIIEIINFMETIYRIDITKELKKRKSYNILNIKIKNLFKGDYPFIVNELLQIIFELYLREKNMEFASIKIQEIIQQCPAIINKNDANAIEGNFILKFCNYNQIDNIDKIKYIQEAIEKINLNLLSVKIEEVVNYLSKFEDINNIIKLCLKKGKLLQPEINTNIDNNPRNNLFPIYNYDSSLFNNDNNKTQNDEDNKVDINKVQIENNVTEFYKCINIILTLLNYLHNSIICNSFEKYIKLNYPNTNIFSYPIYIGNLLLNKTTNDYIRMENLILNLVFNEQYEYIHYNIIEFLKENNMMNKLQEINSPSIEKYLNNQININNNSKQSLFSMFNFYFRNKNYSCATKILANLINYRNSTNIIQEIPNNININYVSLDDRITYVNTMIRTLDLQIKDAEYIQLQEQKIKEIQEAKTLKEKMINIRNLLNIQYEIKSYLTNYLNNAFNNNNNNNLEDFRLAIIKLDNELLDLNTLYQKYAKKFSIFDSCISIFFQIKFANTNNKVDPKEIKSVYCDYFCKLDDETLFNQWPFINFDRFIRIFNTLIKEKTQYQNYYNMLQNNGMKNKYRDIIPLEFIIAIIESMNRKIIFHNNDFFNDDNYYLIKLKQNFSQPHNPFWFINFLKVQIFLPYSYIFNEYYIIYLSLCKDVSPKIGNNISNNLRSNHSNINNDNNLSINTFNSNDLSVFNNSNYEEYGMVFDGNLNGDLSKKISQEAKFYALFLLLGIAKLWGNRLCDIIDNNNDFYLDNQLKTQDELDLKQFYLEIKKNNNQKINNLIKEYFEELKKCKLTFSEQKYSYLKKYIEIIENEIKNAEEKVNNYYSKVKKPYNYYKSDNKDKNFANINNIENQNRLLKINIVGDKNIVNNYMPFNSKVGGGFINLMGNK